MNTIIYALNLCAIPLLLLGSGRKPPRFAALSGAALFSLSIALILWTSSFHSQRPCGGIFVDGKCYEAPAAPALNEQCEPGGREQLAQINKRIDWLQRLPEIEAASKKQSEEEMSEVNLLNAEIDAAIKFMELNLSTQPKDRKFFNDWFSNFSMLGLPVSKDRSAKIGEAQNLLDIMYNRYPSTRPSQPDQLRHAADIIERQENEKRWETQENEDRAKELSRLLFCQIRIQSDLQKQ